VFIRCKECEYRVPEFEVTDELCASCWERQRQEQTGHVRENILCGCGWGILGADQETIDSLNSCPICSRTFDAVLGWA